MRPSKNGTPSAQKRPSKKGGGGPLTHETGIDSAQAAVATAPRQGTEQDAVPAPLDSPARFIVAVGASSGGLEAFRELLQYLPDDTGMAFVLIQHLDPSRPSHLRELLSDMEIMPVVEATDGILPKANHVYVIPPAFSLAMSGGALVTTPRAAGGPHLPVDRFFESLAKESGSLAIGVILSGNGSDGTLGLGAIKKAGGATFAQEPSTAKFESMPSSAIAAGNVDHALPPAEIARYLAAMAIRSGRVADVETELRLPEDASLPRIVALVKSTTGVDFTHYKHSTLARRIQRRMNLRGFKRLDDYYRELQQSRAESTALCENLFITVTSFFREAGGCEALKKLVFPSMVAGREPQDPIRIWVAGCATGEEAYSLAICLTEFLQETGAQATVEVFATDLSELAIEKARAAIYPAAAMARVSAERQANFFTRTEQGYQIKKSIRELCVFARHNVAQDPPFSRLDLVSCCNVLIYLGVPLQRKVLTTLRYALKPGGFLLIGPSENIGLLSGSFEQVDRKQKLFRQGSAVAAAAPPIGDPRRTEEHVKMREKETQKAHGANVLEEADRLVLEAHGPPGVIIDNQMNIIQVRGRTAPYLQLSPGKPTNHLLTLAREGLTSGIGKAIRAARRTDSTSTAAGFRIDSENRFKDVTVQVIPFKGSPDSDERYFLVLFEDAKKGLAKRVSSGTLESDRLHRELVATKDFMQSMVEENATTTEELRAASEEAQAGNEELETAREELESANEELNTLNDELKTKNAEFSKVNRDLSNLLESISIPLVMVDRDLRVGRFTRAIEPMLNLIASDVGRSITDLHPGVELPDLGRLLVDAMTSGDRKPRDVRDEHGRWYSLRVLPSTGPDGKTDGAVLMLIDIDASKRSMDFAEAIVETVREPLVILNQNLQVMSANKTFYTTFQASPKETEGRLIYDLGNGQWNIPSLRELLENILPADSAFRDFEVTHTFERVGRKVMLLNAREIFNPSAQARTILLAIEDATDRKNAEELLRTTNGELQHFAYALTHDLQEPLRMVVNFTELLAQEYAGKMGEDADRYIGYSVEGALRIESLLKALLAYWEVTERERGALTLADCDALLARSLLNLEASILETGAIITHGTMPKVLAEEIPLLQLFQNLISNAIKYRSERVPHIDVSAEKVPDGWAFAIRDNGIGIEAQDTGRVFGLFRRLHGSEIPGTGIGLALCRKIVERKGGRIWVESEPGVGSIFRFTIPTLRPEMPLLTEDRQ